MLARRELPPEFEAWNRRWGAPLGRWVVSGALDEARQFGLDYRLAKVFGPFGFQRNSPTRAHEFPWAYHAIEPKPGLRVLEIGGALAGLQFVLSKEGCEVHNVDPFFDYGSGGYRVDPETRHRQLNRTFKAKATLHRSTLPDAKLDGAFDVIYSVSALEHIPQEPLEETLAVARQLLSPSGRIVLTVDLFLNLSPFSRRETNQWGSNVAPKWIEKVLGMKLVEGSKAELLGYDEFSSEMILEHLEDYALNPDYPQLAQLMVFA